MHKGGIFGTLQAALIVVSLSFLGCELLNNKPEIDVEKTIDAEVAWANAARLTLAVAAPGEWGTSNPPAGMLTSIDIRQGYPFTVEFAPGAAYGFIEWRAYRTSVLDGLPGWTADTEILNTAAALGNGEAEITGGSRPRITVNITEPVTLAPFCVERPRIVNTNLPRRGEREVTNFPIELEFNKALDPATVTMAAFMIYGVRQNAGPGAEVAELTGKDGGPARFIMRPLSGANNNLVRIEAATEAIQSGELANLDFTVVVNPLICEAEYGVSMASRETFSYAVNAGPESNPPVIIGNLYGVKDGRFFTSGDYQNYPIKDTDEKTLYIVFDAFEDMGEVRDIRIIEEFERDNGGGNGEPIEDEDTHPHQLTVSNVQRDSSSPLSAAYQERDNNRGVNPFVVEYELKYPQALPGKFGITALHVQPSDSVGNRGDYILRVWTQGTQTPPGPVQNLRAWYEYDWTTDSSGKTGTIHVVWTNPSDSNIASIDVSTVPSAETGSGSIDTNPGAENTYTITGVGVDSAAVYEIQVTVKNSSNLLSPPVTVRLSPYKDAMVPVTGGTIRAGIGNSGGPFYNASSVPVTVNSFRIGKTEVSYALWWTVYQWATSDDRGENKYTFANAGRAGAASTETTVGAAYGDGAEPTPERKNHPAAFVSWRDAVVWCNAYSEMMGLQPVYRIGGNTGTHPALRVSQDSASYPGSANSGSRAVDGAGTAEAAVAANHLYTGPGAGFRLPLEKEWEFAARGGNPGDTTAWSYTYSGSNSAEDVAWYKDNAGSTVGPSSPNYGTHPAATKNPNNAGTYDMGGNLWEWCQNIHSGVNREVRGGWWNTSTVGLDVGYRGNTIPSIRRYDFGFRLAAPPSP
jgi:formylglycine-generating enzyme required for sulfatase activity